MIQPITDQESTSSTPSRTRNRKLLVTTSSWIKNKRIFQKLLKSQDFLSIFSSHLSNPKMPHDLLLFLGALPIFSNTSRPHSSFQFSPFNNSSLCFFCFPSLFLSFVAFLHFPPNANLDDSLRPCVLRCETSSRKKNRTSN